MGVRLCAGRLADRTHPGPSSELPAPGSGGPARRTFGLRARLAASLTSGPRSASSTTGATSGRAHASKPSSERGAMPTMFPPIGWKTCGTAEHLRAVTSTRSTPESSPARLRSTHGRCQSRSPANRGHRSISTHDGLEPPPHDRRHRVVPRPEPLAALLRAALAGADLDVVVVNVGADCRVRAVVDTRDGVRVVDMQNRGYTAAVNTLATVAEGETVVFTNDDVAVDLSGVGTAHCCHHPGRRRRRSASSYRARRVLTRVRCWRFQPRHGCYSNGRYSPMRRRPTGGTAGSKSGGGRPRRRSSMHRPR